MRTPITLISGPLGSGKTTLLRHILATAPAGPVASTVMVAGTIRVGFSVSLILTWNVQHLANPNKRTHFGVICLRLGVAPPVLATPDMLQEADDE